PSVIAARRDANLPPCAIQVRGCDGYILFDQELPRLPVLGLLLLGRHRHPYPLFFGALPMLMRYLATWVLAVGVLGSRRRRSSSSTARLNASPPSLAGVSLIERRPYVGFSVGFSRATMSAASRSRAAFAAR